MNCIIVDDDEMSRNAMQHLVSQVHYLKPIGTYSNAIEASNAPTDGVDLILLDVEMPEMNGLQFIKSLKKIPLIILATSKKEYALEAFECNVVDYLVKPIAIDRFFKAISRAKEIFDSTKQAIDFSNAEHIFIKVNSTLVKINIKEILWIEALGDYITINTSEKKYTIHSTMKAIETKLAFDKFVRVHRSFIVNIDYIDSIDDTVIVMNKKLIAIGAVYRDNLMKRLNLF